MKSANALARIMPGSKDYVSVGKKQHSCAKAVTLSKFKRTLQ